MSRQSMEGDNEDDASSATSMKDRSLVWSCFEKIEGATPADRKATCHNCGKVYCAKPSSGTRNLKRHMLKCFNFEEGGPPQKRAPLDQDMYREKMAIAIIKHNYPFKYVEHEATRQLHKFLHRDAAPICRNSAKKDVIAIYEREKTKLKAMLEKVSSRISFTADLWSSITNDGYMALTAHYVDETWVLRKKVLNFRIVPPPHSGKMLAFVLVIFLSEWGIENKVFTITLDNAKYNDNLVETLRGNLRLNNVLVCDGKFMHVRCGAHVLNLIVQAGLKVIEGSIGKVRESVKYVRGSNARKTSFAECIAQLHLQCGRLVCQDVVTRWNSTYMMLDCALVYQNAYARLDLVDDNYTCCPTQDEWTRIREITKFLKPFYEITTLFSGNSYPTSNLYFYKVYKIQSNIEEAIRNSDTVISDMGKDMKKKFDKYWNDYCKVLCFAVIMDPRYKEKLINYCFSKLEMTPQVRQEKVDDIVDSLYDLYVDYELHYETIHDSLGDGNENANQSESIDEFDELADFESFPSRFRRAETSGMSELKLYLEEPELPRKTNINVLQFWKDNQARYPRLALMAQDLLSVQITTVASESSFSIGGRILSKYRSSLSPSSAEALLCTRDWLDLEDEKDEMEEELSENLEAYIRR
ncbi:zinc finger BED domain-containing protein RICESLEEPER 2-like protein [Tanacetum coccineum]